MKVVQESGAGPLNEVTEREVCRHNIPKAVVAAPWLLNNISISIIRV